MKDILGAAEGLGIKSMLLYLANLGCACDPLLIEQMKRQTRRQMIKRMELLNRGAFWHGSKKSMYYGNTGCRFFKGGIQN